MAGQQVPHSWAGGPAAGQVLLSLVGLNRHAEGCDAEGDMMSELGGREWGERKRLSAE